MKKLLVILAFILSPLLMMATDYYSVTADVLNVRNQPSKSGTVVGVVKRGEVVAAQSNDYEGWIKISTSSVSGYVSSKYLKYSHSKDTSAQSQDQKPKLTFKKIIGKILGWLIPILLIILSFAVNGDEVWDVFEDGTMVKRPSGGCTVFFVGLIWLIIKIYNLF
ncbi:MAG: SH3 domain-containing protein [Bacteroidales bacterium]|nr:SH3 domain-containing protein [Bacteroidales bacterium]